ncbi:hypothetical protein IFM89_031107 [Coptis chinensis]|uniref:Uncharacterized protein n=1 Tax=Coptis chinensis TaxID=261450 RepID=A0A835IRZ0_9MAGN|nr:hypothetical protein IFM89_031107 [Coptis chinensis]
MQGEGCMAECNLAEESVTFFFEHMKRVDINNDQPSRNEDYNDESTKSSILEGKPLLKGTIITLTRDMVEAAHRCILFNFEEVQPYIDSLESWKAPDETFVTHSVGRFRGSRTLHKICKNRSCHVFTQSSDDEGVKKVPKEGWTMQDGTPWHGNNVEIIRNDGDYRSIDIKDDARLHVVFGKLVQGRRTLKKIEKRGSKRGTRFFVKKLSIVVNFLKVRSAAIAALERESVGLVLCRVEKENLRSLQEEGGGKRRRYSSSESDSSSILVRVLIMRSLMEW